MPTFVILGKVTQEGIAKIKGITAAVGGGPKSG